MSYIEQVQRGIDFIEARLDSEFDLSDVARDAGLSRWHFQRIFKALTSETLKTYIRSRRLANSLEKLLSTDTRIIEIALAAGFESQESFSRAFKKAFNITPNRYRKLGERSLFLRKVRFDSEYLEHINSNISLEPEIRAQGPMRVVGLQTLFYSVDSEKNNIGDTLPPLWQAFLPRLDEISGSIDGICYGVVRQQEVDNDRLEYLAGIEVRSVPSAESLPNGITALNLPSATYAIFAHRGPAQEIDLTVNYIYSSWLFRSGRRHTYGPDLEIYGPEYDLDSTDSVMHYAIPIA